MIGDPWHRASIERGIAAAKAAIAEADAKFDLEAWIDEILWRENRMRSSTPVYQRFHRHARRLTVGKIRASRDLAAVERLEELLRFARQPSTRQIRRVWSRAELGVLITEATNRGRQLRAGGEARAKGPALDPARIPDDRLEWLIQHHRDLAVVVAMRMERRRRSERRAA